MFESYNNIRELVFAFTNGKLSYANQAAQYYFNSYVYMLIGLEYEEFFEWESVSSISGKLEMKENFRERLTLCGGKELDFLVRHIEDEYGRETILFVQEDENKDVAQNILRAASAPSLYDPLRMGKGDMYLSELAKLCDDALYSVSIFKDSALIQRNKDLYLETEKLFNKITRLTDRAKGMVCELTSPESSVVISSSVFCINELIETVSRRVNNYIALEAMDIDFRFTARINEIMISGNYHMIMQAISALIYFAIQYVRASGRKGRINVSLKESNGNAVIDIADNGIGLSEETFKYIQEAETDISALAPGDKKGFLNMQIINNHIQQNNGMLFLNNTKEKGSCSTIMLPLVEKRYSVVRQDSVYSIEDEIDKILRNGII